MAYVCNLNFNEIGTLAIPATGPSNADGSIIATAFDGDGLTVKYKLNSDFDYATYSGITGTFTGLIPGTYTVYARSSQFCLKTYTVVVEWVLTYVPLYRVQFYDKKDQSFQFRFDVEDNTFSGSVTELTRFGPEPVVLSWRGEEKEDLDLPVISSELTLTLVTDSDEDFDDLVDADERRFRGSLYVYDDDLADWKLIWRGYQIPQLAAHAYVLKSNTYKTFTFADQLANLANEPFSDISGNTPVNRLSVFDVIRMCLQKTNIEIQIWETFNVTHDDMYDTADDSALKQIYIDPAVYVNGNTVSDYLTVLKSELSNLFLRLHQSDGHWQIDHVPYCGGPTITRKYAFDGGFVERETINNLIYLRRGKIGPPRVAFRDKSQNRTFVLPYGAINLTYNLGIEQVNNLFKESNFEDEDIANGQLKGWQFENVGSSDISAKIISNESRAGILQFLLNASIGVSASQRVILSSQKVAFNGTTGPYKVEISFDVFTDVSVESTYVTLDVAVELVTGSGTFRVNNQKNADGSNVFGSSTTDLFDGEYVRFYIDEHKTWKTINLVIYVESDPTQVYTGDLQIKVRTGTEPIYDVVIDTASSDTEFAELTAIDINDFKTYNFDYRRRARVTEADTTYSIYTYQIEQSFDTQDLPDLVDPDTYISRKWKLDKSFYSPENDGQLSYLNSIQFHNFVARYLPGEDEKPQETIEYNIEINKRNKVKFEKTYLHGDILGVSTPDDKNYSLISNGWYSFSDGVPTRSLWHPYPFAIPGMAILEALRNWHYGFSLNNRCKLSGTFDFNGVLPSLQNQVFEVRTGRIYLPMSLSMYLRSRKYDSEIIEILKTPAQEDEGDPTPPTEPPVPVGDFDADDFDNGDFYYVH